MIQLLEKVTQLTIIDLKHKTDIQLWSSISEEIGELACELKIEEKIYGNTYKKLDEGVKGEAVDVYILGMAMIVNHYLKKYIIDLKATCEKLNFNNCEPVKDVWKLFHTIVINAAWSLDSPIDATKLCQNCLSLYVCRGGTEKEFLDYAFVKLEKWAAKRKNHV